ncbi:hypothetical protein IAT38_000058 [Cryptococcus sp. DSM 104549]
MPVTFRQFCAALPGVKPNQSGFTNRDLPPFLHWRNYDIIGLDKNTAPAFFSTLDRQLHIVMNPPRSSPLPAQEIELRMDIIPFYSTTEADLYDYETAFFLRCGKVYEWSKKERHSLQSAVHDLLPTGCAYSFARAEISRTY